MVDPGSLLRQWMKRYRVTRAELARRLDIAPGYLGYILRGSCTPGDGLKLTIERVTHEMECELARSLKLPEPTEGGIRATVWIEALRRAG